MQILKEEKAQTAIEVLAVAAAVIVIATVVAVMIKNSATVVTETAQDRTP
jgi:hypothetical protein